MKQAIMVLALVLALAAPALAGGFLKSRKYMSAQGYARWQYFLTTGVWRAR
jgi:hypothetical protein